MDNFNNPPITNPPGGAPPENYLVWSILATIFCCIPLGIVAIIKSTKVNELWNLGDQMGALKASADAKKWTIYAAIIGPIFTIIMWVVIMFFGFAGALFDAGSY